MSQTANKSHIMVAEGKEVHTALEEYVRDNKPLARTIKDLKVCLTL